MILESSKSESDFGEFISDPSDPIDIRHILDKGNPILKELIFCTLNSFGSDSPLCLNRQLELEIDFENDYYIIENDTFRLFSFEKDMKEALHSLEIQFELLWKVYVLDDESKLAPSGLELKNRLKEYMSEK